MKVLRHIFPLIISFLLSTAAYGQDYTETISRRAQFSNPSGSGNELRIYNVHGSVNVEGYDGNEILVTAEQQIDGTSRQIEQARRELEFIVEQNGDRVLVYIDAPFINLYKDEDDGSISYRIDRWDDDYDFLYDITVRVPHSAGLHVSTINRGEVIVRNTSGTVSASNVNGRISLEGIAGTTRAHTVNGDISASYAQSPTDDSKYRTVNGDIEVNYPEDLSADIRFKSLHGELYTDFQNIERLQAKLDQSQSKQHGGITYKIDRFAPIRIGQGGPTFSFEVLNGDVYVKRIKS